MISPLFAFIRPIYHPRSFTSNQPLQLSIKAKKNVCYSLLFIELCSNLNFGWPIQFVSFFSSYFNLDSAVVTVLQGSASLGFPSYSSILSTVVLSSAAIREINLQLASFTFVPIASISSFIRSIKPFLQYSSFFPIRHITPAFSSVLSYNFMLICRINVFYSSIQQTYSSVIFCIPLTNIFFFIIGFCLAVNKRK